MSPFDSSDSAAFNASYVLADVFTVISLMVLQASRHKPCSVYLNNTGEN
jgi:hypothetical protein